MGNGHSRSRSRRPSLKRSLERAHRLGRRGSRRKSTPIIAIHPPNSAPPSAALVALEDALHEIHVDLSELSPEEGSCTFIDQITGTKTWMNIMDASSTIKEKSEKKLQHPQRLKLLSSLPNSTPRCYRPMIKIFLSSTFTDTRYERDTFLTSVDHILQQLALALGCDYESIEMRWGITDKVSNSHKTTDTCLHVINKTLEESDTLSFIYISTDKYGFRDVPSQIPSDQMSLLVDVMDPKAKDLFYRAYREDTNIAPNGAYVIQSLDDNNVDLNTLRDTLLEAGKNAGLSNITEDLEKSVTFREVEAGILNNPKAELKSFCFIRDLQNLDQDDGGYFDYEGQQVEHLRDLVKQSLPGNRIDFYRVDYRDLKDDDEMASEAVQEFIQKTFAVGAAGILKAATSVRYIQDPVLKECATHADVAIELRANATVCPSLQKIIGTTCETLNSNRKDHLTALFGPKGSGRSTTLALVLESLKEAQTNEKAKTMVVYRHLSSYGDDSLLFMKSVARQLNTLRRELHNLPTVPDALEEEESLSWDDVRAHFFASIRGFEPGSLLLAFDGLDQMDRPLPALIPPLDGQSIIFTSLAPVDCPFQVDWVDLNVLVQEEEFIHSVFHHHLGAQGRQITDKQAASLDQVLTETQGEWSATKALALAYLAGHWPSWQEDNLVVSDPVVAIFQHAENLHGNAVVTSISSLLLVSRYGLSESEIIDILSLDDTLLDTVYQYWDRPVRRCPHIVVEQVLELLRPFLFANVPKSSSGTKLLQWKYETFAETARSRYIKDNASEKFFRQLLVDYFSGAFAKGKEYKGKMHPRLVQPQAMVYRDSGAESYNLRRAAELPHQLLKLEDWSSFVRFHGEVEMSHAQELLAGSSQDELIMMTKSYLRKQPTSEYDKARKRLMKSYFDSITDETSFDVIEHLATFFGRMSWFDGARKAQELVLAQRELVEPDTFAHVQSVFNLYYINYRGDNRTPTLIQTGAENIERLEQLLKHASGPSPKQMKALSEMKATQAACLLQVARNMKKDHKGSPEEIEDLLKRSLELRQSSFDLRKDMYGLEHAETAKALGGLSVTYRELGDYESALLFAEKCLHVRETILAPNDPAIALSLENVHKAFVRVHGLEATNGELLIRAFDIVKAYYGEVHGRIGRVLKALGMFYFDCGRASEAREVLMYAAEIFCRLRNSNSMETNNKANESAGKKDKDLDPIFSKIDDLESARWSRMEAEDSDLFVEWLANAQLDEALENTLADLTSSSYVQLATLLCLDDSVEGKPLNTRTYVNYLVSSKKPSPATSYKHTRLNLALSESGMQIVVPEEVVEHLITCVPAPRCDLRSYGDERILVASSHGIVLARGEKIQGSQPHVDFIAKCFAKIAGGSCLTWDSTEVLRSETTLSPHFKNVDPNHLPIGDEQQSPFYQTLSAWNLESPKALMFVCHGRSDWFDRITGARGAISIGLGALEKRDASESAALESHLIEALSDTLGQDWAIDADRDYAGRGGRSWTNLSNQYLSMNNPDAVSVDISLSRVFRQHLVVNPQLRELVVEALMSTLSTYCA